MAQTAPNLASAKTFGLLSGGTIFSADTTVVAGNAGASTAVSPYVKATTIYTGGGTVSTALSNLATAKSFCTGQTGTAISGTLAGQSLTPGVYNVSGNATLNGAITLAGDTNAIYIFNITGNLLIDSAIYYGYQNLMPSKIFWNITGTLTINSYNSIYGIVMSGGTITLYPFTHGSMALLSQGNITINNDSTTKLRGYIAGTKMYSQNEILKSGSLRHLDNCLGPVDPCNMVINPSFEELEVMVGTGGILYCPDQTNQIHAACDWDSYYWLPVVPYTRTPSAFSDCDDYTYPTTGDVGVPWNIFNDPAGPGQPAHNSGHNYAGIQHAWVTTYDPQDDTPPPPYDIATWENNEKLEKYLPAPLIANKVYYMEFYSSLADKSNTTELLGVYPATSQFFLGTIPIPPLYYPGGPFFTTGTYVTTNTSWNKYSGCVSTPRSDIDVISIKSASGSIPVTPSDPSFYTPFGVLGFHSMSYFYIDDIALRPLADAGADLNYNCATTNIIGLPYSTCGPISGATYSWAPVGAFTAANAVIVSPTNPFSEISCTVAGTYVFEITVTYGGCSDTDQITVTNPSSACAGVTLIPTTTYLAAGSPHFIGAGSPVMVGGNLTINSGATLIIQNDDVSFFANKTIAVMPGGTLEIDGAWLHGCNPCGTMWGGVYLFKGGNLVVKNGSLIEDAIAAVTAGGFGTGIPNYQISQSIFNKNTDNIILQANTGNMSANTIKNTVFTCRTLPAPTGSFITYFNTIKAGVATYPTTVTRAGIRSSKGVQLIDLSNGVSPVKIGNAAGGATDVNIFDNLDYGIHVQGTYIEIRNNRFQNMAGMQPFAIPSPPPYGIGIYAPVQSVGISNYMWVGDVAVPNAENYFSNCFRGIEINNYRITRINDNFFTCSSTPTSVSGNTIANIGVNLRNITETIELNSNTLTNWINGIWINRNTASGGLLNPPMDINANNINANSSGYCTQAILVSDIIGNTITTVHPFYIRNNSIYDVKNGIKVTHFKNNMVIYNNPQIVLRYASNGAVAGIWLDGCDKTEVKNNTISSLRSPYGSGDNWDLRGIYVKASTNNKVFCNTLNFLGQCMVFEGGCLSTTNSSYSGTTNGILGNNMDNARTGLMLRTSGIIGQQGTSTFASSNSWNNAYTFPNGRTYTYFTTSANINSKLYCINTATYLPPLATIMTNSGAAQEYHTATPTGLNVATGSAIACPSVYVPPGMIVEKNGGLKSMSSDEVAYAEELKQLLSTVSSTFVPSEWMLQQFIYNELNEHAGLLEDSLLNVFYSSNQTQAFGLFNSHNAALQNFDYVQATAYNNSVIPANIIEQNQQAFNAIYLAHVDSGAVYSEADCESLNAIAAQCSSEGGDAVIQSRNLIMQIQNQIIEFENDCDISIPVARQMVVAEEDSHNIRLFPNPNNGNMLLECNLIESESGLLNIYDITGKLVQSYKLTTETKTQLINGHMLESGVYLYDIVVNGRRIKTEKLTIIK